MNQMLCQCRSKVKPNSVRFGTRVERRLNRAWDAHADALNIINPLSPKRDQHQISPCNINCFVKQSGHENYGHDHTRQICLIFYQPLPTTSVGNEWGQQMRIQILILGFKGLIYSRTSLFRTRLIRSPRYFEGRSNALGFTLPLYASPVISRPRYFELFFISLGTSK